MIEEKETDTEIQKAGPKTALVSIVGRPSAGKSTFLNTASGEKVSIVSPVPQTTRNAIRGIINTSLGQLVFIDTPGLHLSEPKTFKHCARKHKGKRCNSLHHGFNSPTQRGRRNDCFTFNSAQRQSCNRNQ